MKIAIVHDHFLVLGGAERVLLAFLEMYPHADVYLAFCSEKHKRLVKKITTGRVKISFWQRLLPSPAFYDWFKPVLFGWWESLDLSRYDLIISSSHSFSAKSVIARHLTKHVAYIYTPPRYLYNEYNETRWVTYPVVRSLLSPIFAWMRKKDFEGAQRPDVLIAISKTVQARIKKYYGRDSVVVYPPVVVSRKQKTENRKKKKYYLCVGRLVRQKGIDLAIRACNELKEKLVVVGVGAQEKYLRKISGPTIEFKGFVPDEQMAEIYAGAKALIYPSIQEDFGIVPVETMAHGVPVIAYRSGGTVETIVEDETGLFFDEYSVIGLVDAMKKWRKREWNTAQIRKQAGKFSSGIFRSSFTSVVSRCMSPH